MPGAGDKKKSAPKKSVDAAKQGQAAVGARRKTSSKKTISNNSSSRTKKVSESQSENGNGFVPMPIDLDVSREWSSTLSAMESDSSSQRSSERTYGLEVVIKTFGNPEQVLQEAQTALKALTLAGIEVSHYRINVDGH